MKLHRYVHVQGMGVGGGSVHSRAKRKAEDTYFMNKSVQNAKFNKYIFLITLYPCGNFWEVWGGGGGGGPPPPPPPPLPIKLW